MSTFSIATIRPPGFAHSSCFRHVQESLSWSLSALGHDATIAADNFLDSDPGVTNIIFGGELLATGSILGKNCIIYNLEQTQAHEQMDKLRWIAATSKIRVWDYSKIGVQYWQSHGIDVRHVPIGYTPNLTRIPDLTTMDGCGPIYDVLFYGWLTPRRAKILEELQRAGLKVAPVVSPLGCYGGGLDNLIARAKVVLNVHHDGRTQFEIVRISYLLANGKCVVSETSSDDAEYKDLVVQRVAYEELPRMCKAALRAHISGERVRSPFMARDYTATVREALDRPDSDESWQASEAILNAS